MPKFRQEVEALYAIEVEAEDFIQADLIISEMSETEFISKATLIEIYNDDTEVFPELT
jgi:hypothetical protein